jgi:hypothetical protein
VLRRQAREGGLAEKSSSLVLEALTLAVAAPAGQRLFGSKGWPGLFRSTGAARQAAQQCKDEGYLRVVSTEAKAKTVQEICAITEKGLAFVLGQLSPKSVLESLVLALNSRQAQLAELAASARQTHADFDALKTTIEKVLAEVVKAPPPLAPGPSANGSEAWKATALAHLAEWSTSRPAEDCPLSDLYQHARKQTPTLSLGRFHDGIRQLHEEQKIYLHPWTGPLYELPDPACALLVGHEIVYYASLRT